jgi:hypothetical protein
LQSGAATWEATVQIKGAVEVGAKKFRVLAAHAARVSVLVSESDSTTSSEEEDEEVVVAAEEEEEEEEKTLRTAEGAATSVEQREATHVSTDVDLLIIGAGASGVGCGVMAKSFGVDPSRTLIVERGSAVGSTFDRWPAEMRFITPSVRARPGS